MEQQTVSEITENEISRQNTHTSTDEVVHIEEPVVHADVEEESEEYDGVENSVENSEDYDEDEDDQEGGDSDSDIDNKVAIDLSDNDFYKGLCTLLEDEHGNNILEYVSLLHTELIGVNKNLKLVRKEMNRMANCAEIMVKKSS